MEEEYNECELPDVLNDATLQDYCMECEDYELCSEYYKEWDEDEYGFEEE